MSLEFYEAEHKYTLDGEEIPSVSEILRFATREVYQETDSFAMEAAADRGKRVHKAAEELDRTGRCECDGDIEGYVIAYRNFLREHDVKWDAIEKPVYDESAWYAGTIDRAGLLDKQPVILDIKTTKKISGKHKLLYSAQLTAYKYAYTTNLYDTKLMILQLHEDGTYKLIPIKDNPTVFTACKSLHKEFEKTKRRKRNGKVATD